MVACTNWPTVVASGLLEMQLVGEFIAEQGGGWGKGPVCPPPLLPGSCKGMETMS